MNDYTDYAVRIIRGGGSSNGDVVDIFPTLALAREFIDDPPEWLGGCALSIYTLEPCWEEGDDDD